MNDELEDRILMSESLQGRLPELDDQLASSLGSFVLFAMVLLGKSGSHIVAGSVVGMSFEEASTKFDIRIPIDQAYEFVVTHLESPWVCAEYHRAADKRWRGAR